VQAAPEVTRLIRVARQVNDDMPRRLLDRLTSLARPPARIAILGVTYKANVDDIRESPALAFACLAAGEGFDVRLCDPHAAANAQALPMPLVSLEDAARGADALVLLVDHAEFRHLDPGLLAPLVRQKQLLDARSAVDVAAWRASGFVVHVLGDGRTAE
jgi:UDP-N-acetyl-D-mannosaminuronic acid dehydrogenase